MKKTTLNVNDLPASKNEEPVPVSKSPSHIDRRKFIKTAATGALALTIVPRHVLGGTGFVAPSDKLTLAYVGCGTQGLRELLPLLAVPGVQVVAVCDPNQYAVGYRDWSKNGIRDEVRAATGKSDWSPGGDNGVAGGRDNGKDIVNTYYSSKRSGDNFKGCTAYADFRELLRRRFSVGRFRRDPGENLAFQTAHALHEKFIKIRTRNT